MTLDGSTAERDDAPPPAPRPARPPQIPGYRLDGIIGRGTTGTVYRAVQLAVERDVAVKVLHPELAARPQVVQRLQREARTMAKLAHPHVVGAIDMGEAEGRWWFAMELVDGPSLAQLLRTDGPLPEREALRLFAPLCEALEHLWEHGVVHRDVKPANVLLERAGRGRHRHYRARLADLGLAVGERDPALTSEGGTVGTPHYIAPEQARDARHVDVRADLWSLGATLYEAVCGRPPFGGRSAAEVLSAVLHEPVPDPRSLRPGLSAGLVLVLRKCLVRDPERRYQAPDELLADLERLRERRAPEVRRGELDPLARDPRPWRRPVVWAAGLAAVSLVALGAALTGPAPAGEPRAPMGGAAADPLAPVRELRVAAADEPRLLWTALEAADGVHAEAVAAGASDDWRDLRRALVTELQRALGVLERDLAARVDAHLRAADDADLEAARAEVSGFEARVRSTLGVATAELPAEVRAPHERVLDGVSDRIEQVRAARVEDVRRAVRSHWEALVEPEVERLEEAERWRSARALLVATPSDLVRRADLAAGGLGTADLAQATAEVLDAMARRRAALDRRWTSRQRELRNAVEAKALALGLARWPEVPQDPAVALPAELAAQLERLGLAEDEIPLGGLEIRDELPALVERSRDALAADLEAGARADAELRRSFVAPSLGRERAYGEMEALWSAFERRLDAVPQALAGGGWVDELGDEARAGAFEGRLLEGFMEEAGRAVLELVGSQASFEVQSGIRPQGRVRCSGDPLEDGFRLEIVASSRPYLLGLRASTRPPRSVTIGDLEGLIGFVPDETDPARAVGRVCLRWYAGDLDGAVRLWSRATDADALFDSGPGALLTARIPGRLLRGLPGATGPAAPEERAARLLEVLDEGLAERDRELAAWVARTLLAEHLGETRVQLQAATLRELSPP